MPALNTVAIALLGATTLDLSTDGDTTIYTVPSGKSCVPVYAPLAVGSDAGASKISIGQAGNTDDWLPQTTLATTSVDGDVFLLQPIPDLTSPVKKAYPAGTVIKATVSDHAGGADNTLYFFGFLF